MSRQMDRLQPTHAPGPRTGRAIAAVLFALGAATAVAFEHGFDQPPAPLILLRATQVLLPWLALLAWGDVIANAPPPARWKRTIGAAGEVLVAAALVTELLGAPLVAESVAILAAIGFASRFSGLLARRLPNPPVLFPASFLLLITLAALLLKLPAATPADQPIGWIDALFTATSAVCVTGLAVRDTAAGFTPFGQAVILGAIQLGGLGVMIFGSTLALLFGSRPSFREHVTLSMALDEYPAQRIERFAWFIVLTTLILEACGALINYITWPAEQLADVPRLWCAVFHSVSAFCNAGFDITGNSLVGLRDNAAILVGVMPMIILGGLGFIVLEDVYRQIRGRLRGRRKRFRLTLHSKVVLITTAILLLGGFVTIMVAQTRAAGGLSPQAVTDAAFMSATARTAGFTSVPMEELTPGARFTLMVLMSIGGSPGSTAGGMKTVVFAVLILAIISTVRGRDEVEVLKRALPDALVKKAATVAAGLFGVIAASMLILDLTEQIAFEPLFFEVISAATTTGLSLGATNDLTPVGRVVITATMFLGRVGALSLLAALMGYADAGGRYRLPHDTVSLG